MVGNEVFLRLEFVLQAWEWQEMRQMALWKPSSRGGLTGVVYSSLSEQRMEETTWKWTAQPPTCYFRGKPMSHQPFCAAVYRADGAMNVGQLLCSTLEIYRFLHLRSHYTYRARSFPIYLHRHFVWGFYFFF